jgi:CDP-diacylglycerol--glycerol-3-phosphate 3-phosphatidyltransferase
LPALLRRRARHEAWGHALLGLGFFYLLIQRGPAHGVIQGALASIGVLAVVHGLLWRHLDGNRPLGSSGIMVKLGTANRITLFRGFLISLVAGFLFCIPEYGQTGKTAWVWWPGCIYLAAAVLDGVDGFWARRTGTQTRLGAALDVNMDALGLLVASAVAVGSGRLPAYYLAAGWAYYLLQLGVWHRRKRGGEIHPSGSRALARLMAGIQMGFVGFALLPIFAASVLEKVAPLFLVPFLLGFIWDWALMHGHLRQAVAGRVRKILVGLAAKGPSVLRAGLLVWGGLLLQAAPLSALSNAMLTNLALGLMVVMGFLGRSAALLLSIHLACQASVAGSPPDLLLALSAAVVIMMYGTGDGSLWRPEDALLLRESGRQA